tara:strand:+ start:2168 stop:2401 length:234 start_codon:yes stop_codon:yes gene_type:complete
MFERRQIVENPVVLRRHDLFENKFVYRQLTAKGVFYRVIPSTWKEISYIRLLEKGITYEVPAEGNGLLIAYKAAPRQ